MRVSLRATARERAAATESTTARVRVRAAVRARAASEEPKSTISRVGLTSMVQKANSMDLKLASKPRT
jgi:hypothetical protein